jgi:hypothetical protein
MPTSATAMETSACMSHPAKAWTSCGRKTAPNADVAKTADPSRPIHKPSMHLRETAQRFLKGMEARTSSESVILIQSHRAIGILVSVEEVVTANAP